MRRKRHLTNNEIEQLKKLWSQGLTVSKITEKTGLRLGTVNGYFSSFNRGFDSVTQYLNFKALQAGYIDHNERYPYKRAQQRFEDSISFCPIKKLYSKIKQQKDKDYKITHFYEIDPHELIPKLLNELEKIKAMGNISLIDVIKKCYFESKSFKKIGKEEGLSYQRISALNENALEKLREIIQRTKFSEMF